MTNEEALIQFFQDVIKDVRADQETKKIKASGHSADSLAFGVDGAGGQLTGSDYFYFQIHGRKKGAMPPVNDILAWVKAKGIQADISPDSLAWAIAKKIAKFGTDISQGKRNGLAFEQIVSENKEKLIGKLSDGIKLNIVNNLKEALQPVS